MQRLTCGVYKPWHYDDDLLSLADYNEAIEFEDDDTVLVEVHDTLDEAYDDEVG